MGGSSFPGRAPRLRLRQALTVLACLAWAGQGAAVASRTLAAAGGAPAELLLVQPVPVILAVGPASAAAVATSPESGGVVLAAAVNTTRCLRYAGLGPGGETVAAASASTSSRQPRALDTSACAAATTAVQSAEWEVVIQVKVHALASALPEGALRLSGGAGSVVSVSSPRLEGPFQVFDVSLVRLILRSRCGGLRCSLSAPQCCLHAGRCAPG